MMADRVQLIHGDCIEEMRRLIGAGVQVDAIVTDPPYFFSSIVQRFGKANAAPARSEGATGVYRRASAGFMGRSWDAPEAPAIDPSFAHWFAGFVDGEGCFSVHKKTVNGCETYDCQFSIALRRDDAPIVREIQRQLGGIGTIAMRDQRGEGNAKPQVRYCISSKADCQRLQAILSVFPLRAKKARDFEIWSHALDAWVHHEPGGSWENVAYFREALMDVRQYGAAYHPGQLFFYRWAKLALQILKPGGHLIAFNSTKSFHRMVIGIEDAGFEIRDSILNLYSAGERWQTLLASLSEEQRDAMRAALDHSDPDTLAWLYASGFPKSHNLSGDWSGWGSALKPAAELITLARKPLSEGSVAANVLRHGTGALNIDACRVPTGVDDEAMRVRHNRAGTGNRENWRTGARASETGGNALGRWPANVVHDGSDEVEAAFAHFGEGKGAFAPVRGTEPSTPAVNVYGKFNRNPGGAFHSDSGSASRFFYSAKADADDRFGSAHATVKPIDLIRWLIRMVTPKGGLVLDPFAGSGTTGVAAIAEGCHAILIEREADHCADIRVRLDHIAGSGGHSVKVKNRNRKPKKAEGLLAMLEPGEAAE